MITAVVLSAFIGMLILITLSLYSLAAWYDDVVHPHHRKDADTGESFSPVLRSFGDDD